MFGLEWFPGCTLPPPALLLFSPSPPIPAFPPSCPSLLLSKKKLNAFSWPLTCSQNLPGTPRGIRLRCPEWTRARNTPFISFIPFPGSLPTPLTGIPGVSFWINYLLPNPCPRVCFWGNRSVILQILPQKAVTVPTLLDLLFPH